MRRGEVIEIPSFRRMGGGREKLRTCGGAGEREGGADRVRLIPRSPARHRTRCTHNPRGRRSGAVSGAAQD